MDLRKLDEQEADRAAIKPADQHPTAIPDPAEAPGLDERTAEEWWVEYDNDFILLLTR
jgi:hypothetical protein